MAMLRDHGQNGAKFHIVHTKSLAMPSFTPRSTGADRSKIKRHLLFFLGTHPIGRDNSFWIYSLTTFGFASAESLFLRTVLDNLAEKPTSKQSLKEETR